MPAPSVNTQQWGINAWPPSERPGTLCTDERCYHWCSIEVHPDLAFYTYSMGRRRTFCTNEHQYYWFNTMREPDRPNRS